MKKAISGSGFVFTAAFLVSVFAATPSAFATTRYIAQTAGTFSGGSACNGQTTITPATFNGTTNAAGDLDYICGTITVAANTEALKVNGSGTSASPITLKFDSGAVLSSPEWPADGTGGAIDVGGNSYIVIDGNGGANGWTQGIIEATANGDSGAPCLSGSCTDHGDSNGVEGDGATYITVTGLAIIDMYVTTGNPNPGGGTCVYDVGSATGWTVSNNLMHDVGWCVEFQYEGTTSNITISGNTIYNIDHGIALGGPESGATLSNVTISGNNIHDYSNWDTSNDEWHHDGVHIWGYNDNGSDHISGITINNNKFGGCIGQNVTAHVFIEQNAGGDTNVTVYNNSFIDTCSGNENDGMLAVEDSAAAPLIYNNTFIGASTDTCAGFGDGSPSNITFVNNVVSGCGIFMYVPSPASFAAGGLHNNIYAACPGSNCFAYHDGDTNAFSSWQSATGQDASPSAYVSTADLSAAGVPQSGSPVIGAGVNLTSLSITALDSDITGAARPAVGAWTVGAYTNTGVTPAAPTGLTGTIVTN